MVERGIKVDDISQCINTGEIIKQYEDDKPLPSCLILGKSMADFTTDVVKHLEDIVEQAKKLMQEISIIDYNKVA